MAGEVDHDGYVAALPGEARAAASRDDWGIMLAAVPDGLNHLVAAPWCHDADRHLAVVGGVGGEEGSALGTKIHCHAVRSPAIRLKRPRAPGGVRREFGRAAARRRPIGRAHISTPVPHAPTVS